ncbi:MAG: alpha-amylase/4-alpha-glucanotransferase domain-containing protein [Anaerolineae bacterium]
MGKRIYLALALHNHQPVGNFDHVFAQAFHDAYEPLIAALERHPGMRLALHYSGPLRDWLLRNRPEFLPRVRALVARGQIEPLTGGYYEPILTSIPDADKLGQIAKLTAAVVEDFGTAPTGLWLAERVWEPHLPLPLAQAGVRYTLVDDTHFKYVGLTDQDLFGYYVTEEQGRTLSVFATSKHLRYTIPWASVEETIAYLRDEASEAMPRLAVMGDDGEKFGLWPTTYTHVWQQGWMDEFLSACEANAEWLHTITPGEYLQRFPALGRIYLPTASYDEMGEWALPPELSWEITHLKHRLQTEQEEDILRFIRGGFWRSFLVKYPEINHMHKKMLLVSDKCWSLPPTPERDRALDALWAGQCNCPYWHGVFGGAYLFHIRSANYERLLEAEARAEECLHGLAHWAEPRELDLDRDGDAEILLQSDAVNLYFAPTRGGACYEWDWRARRINLLNIMNRRPEGYHRDLSIAAAEGTIVAPDQPAPELESIHTRLVRVRERGLEQRLVYDRYRHGSFIDHWLPTGTTLEDVYRMQHQERGDLLEGSYVPSLTQGPDRLSLSLSREGHVWQGDCFCPLSVHKTVTIRPGSPHVEAGYRLANPGPLPLEGRFAVETCWALLGGNGPTASAVVPGAIPFGFNEPAATATANEIHLRLGWLDMDIAIHVEPAAEFWLFPLETISNSEGGFERIYQGTCLLACWPLRLEGDSQWAAHLRFEPR